MLSATAITDRSAEAGYPLAFHTGNHLTDRDGAHYLSLLTHQYLGVDDWTFDAREQDQLRWENEPRRNCTRSTAAKFVVAKLRHANGYRVDVPDGYVTYGEPHYYGDCRHTIVVHGPIGDRLHSERRLRWREFVGVGDGYVTFPDSAVMRAIADLAMLDRWAHSESGLAFVVLPCYQRGVRGSADIVHIGSMQRTRRDDGGWHNWEWRG